MPLPRLCMLDKCTKHLVDHLRSFLRNHGFTSITEVLPWYTLFWKTFTVMTALLNFADRSETTLCWKISTKLLFSSTTVKVVLCNVKMPISHDYYMKFYCNQIITFIETKLIVLQEIMLMTRCKLFSCVYWLENYFENK